MERAKPEVIQLVVVVVVVVVVVCCLLTALQHSGLDAAAKCIPFTNVFEFLANVSGCVCVCVCVCVCLFVCVCCAGVGVGVYNAEQISDVIMCPLAYLDDADVA